MKKLIITITLICATSGYLSAQLSIHEFSVYGGGGLSTLRYQLSQGDVSTGLGGNVGVGYTYLQIINRAVETGKVAFHQTWGIHIGIGAGIYNANANLNRVKTVTAKLTDSETHRFDLHTALSGYEETQTAMFLNIPVMGQFNIDQFYIMCGIKAGIPLSGTYKSKGATLTNEAYYPEWDNWMKTQKFVGYGAFSGKEYEGDIDFGVSVALALETGMNWGISKNVLLYSGVYLDYGLNNIANSDYLPFINYDAKNPANFTTNSVLSSYVNDSRSTTFTDKVSTMAIGIKLRLAFRT